MEKVVILRPAASYYTGMARRSPRDVGWLLHLVFATTYWHSFTYFVLQIVTALVSFQNPIFTHQSTASECGEAKGVMEAGRWASKRTAS